MRLAPVGLHVLDIGCGGGLLASFDVVYCCDVLEHVNNVPQVIAETARVLRPGGTYLYDTINRTLRSRWIVIKLLQEWRWTALMPPGLHDWKLFIRPAELQRELVRHGLMPGGLTGLKPRRTRFASFAPCTGVNEAF